jgi:hypothetical protein
MNLRSGAWNVKSIQKSGLLRKVASGLAKCRLDLMAAQDEGYDKDSPEQTKNYERVLSYGKWERNLPVGCRIFIMHKRIISLVPKFVINTKLCT